MCVVSMISEHYQQKFPNSQPAVSPPLQQGQSNSIVWDNGLRKDVYELKKELLEIKALLLKAKEYDLKTNQVDCEKEEKIVVLKRLAELVGVDLSDVFSKT